MAVEEANWRIDILEKSQKRFEEFVIRGALDDLVQVEMNLRRMQAAGGKLGGLGAKAIEMEFKKVEAMKSKLMSVWEIGRANMSAQIAGELGVQVDGRSGEITFCKG